MIGDIMKAVLNEAKAFLQTSTFQGNPFAGTVILETNYKSDKLLSYAMPLLLIDMMDAPEESQYPGGVTRVDWVFGFNSYNLEPDGYVDDDSTFSADLLDIVDAIRQHFSLRFWTVPSRGMDTTIPMAMDDICAAYGFKFTLSGLTRANKLEQDGLIMGWRIMFDSIAIDDSTDWTMPAGPLTTVNQVGYPPDE